MKTIALTGNPTAQDAAALQLQALINGRNLRVSVRIGVTQLAEAQGIKDAGGEVWHCGVDEPQPDLAHTVDRKLTARTFEAMSSRVAMCLGQFIGNVHRADADHAELLRQCHLSGQMTAAQSVAHFAGKEGE